MSCDVFVLSVLSPLRIAKWQHVLFVVSRVLSRSPFVTVWTGGEGLLWQYPVRRTVLPRQNVCILFFLLFELITCPWRVFCLCPIIIVFYYIRNNENPFVSAVPYCGPGSARPTGQCPLSVRGQSKPSPPARTVTNFSSKDITRGAAQRNVYNKSLFRVAYRTQRF